jgi:DnaJ-class molecular chaperone
MEQCAICEGTGKIWRSTRDPRLPTEGQFDCHECGGSGEIPLNEYIRDNGQFGVGA